MTKYLRVSFIIILLAISAICCTPAKSAEGIYPIEITDQTGRLVKFTKVSVRIISLAPSNTEILYALGLKDQVVGVTDYDDYPPEVKEKNSIGSFFSPNIETIVALNPDLILATTVHVGEVIPHLENLGLKVVALDPKSVDEVLAAINIVGKITGKEEEARSLTTGMQNRIQAITSKTNSLPETKKPSVFYITWHDPIQTSGSGNLGDDLIMKAGGRNIFHKLEGAPFVSLEEVVQANPEVIIAGIGMGTGGDATLQLALNEPRFRSTTARLNNRIYPVDINLVGRPGPRIVDGLEQFARLIHPELFK